MVLPPATIARQNHFLPGVPFICGTTWISEAPKTRTYKKNEVDVYTARAEQVWDNGDKHVSDTVVEESVDQKYFKMVSRVSCDNIYLGSSMSITYRLNIQE